MVELSRRATTCTNISIAFLQDLKMHTTGTSTVTAPSFHLLKMSWLSSSLPDTIFHAFSGTLLQRLKICYSQRLEKVSHAFRACKTLCALQTRSTWRVNIKFKSRKSLDSDSIKFCIGYQKKITCSRKFLGICKIANARCIVFPNV